MVRKTTKTAQWERWQEQTIVDLKAMITDEAKRGNFAAAALMLETLVRVAQSKPPAETDDG